MKNIVLVMSVLFLGALVSGCEKSSSNSVTGTWKILSDSSITSGGTTSYNVYVGNSGDYFAFASNEILRTQEGSINKTFSYSLSPGNKITLTETGSLTYAVAESGPYEITGDKMRIEITPSLTNPGFSFKRIINLKR